MLESMCKSFIWSGLLSAISVRATYGITASTTESESRSLRYLRIIYGGESHWNKGAGMGLHGAKDIELRFSRYVDALVGVIGHADRAGPFRDYCTGLMMPGERKSVEPMAAITAPGRTAAQHQSLLHFVGQGAWSDEDVLTKVRQMVLPQMTRDGPIEAWIIDDTGLPKKGQHSVGVSHQYCGQLGKQANCQVAVTLSRSEEHTSELQS